MDAGVHTLSHLAVLCSVESGDSCRKIGEELTIPYSTVWQATKALEDQGLIGVEQTPCNRGRGIRWILTLSDRGRQLIADLGAMLTPPPKP